MDKSPFSEAYKVFIELLKELRRQAGITQADLADALHENQSFVSKCERGERRIDIVELREFCRAIGISLTAFTDELDRRLTIIEDAHES